MRIQAANRLPADLVGLVDGLIGGIDLRVGRLHLLVGLVDALARQPVGADEDQHQQTAT